MEADRPAATATAEPDDELLRLVVSFKAARQDGNNSLARRYIDRAWRIVPDRPEINYLYGQLLLLESPASALPFLAKAAEGQPTAHFASALISALAANDRPDLACDRLVLALREFAVVPGGALAKVARSITRDLAPRWPGWVGIAPDMRLVGELVSAGGFEALDIFDPLESGARRHLVHASVDGIGPFTVKPSRIWPRRTIESRVRGALLLGGEVRFMPDFGFDGRATLLDGTLTGWVSIGWTNGEPAQILISGRGGFRLQIGSTSDALDPTYHRFSIDRRLCDAGGNRLVFSVLLPDGAYARFPDTPLLIDPPRPPRPRRRDASIPRRPWPERPETVDIVIPVYKGVSETLACIQSVIDTVGDAEIVVIDDASPEAEMGPALDALASSGKITLLRNPRNLGFPRSVNRGFGLHPDRDVVVLNSDTEVYGDWLERLRDAALSADDIGSATPLTNSGSIASYPKSEDDCSSVDAAERDRVARAINDGDYVDAPTGVGFCIYLRRRCLDQVGYFDAVTFARGYGEENDLCLRAAQQGWRHILATNVFVRHLGSRSFGARRKALFERNNRLINLRYPGYDDKIQVFLADDPMHAARRRLDQEFLVRAGRRHVLLVTLALEGGVRRAVNERVEYWRDNGATALSLKPDAERPGRIILTVDGLTLDDLSYELPGELPRLSSLLERLSIECIELHHFLGLPPELIEHLFLSGYPVDVWVHDYVWYCPRITLLGSGDVYCGEPPASACEMCVEENGSTLREFGSVADLRERSARWLSSARSVLVPSEGLGQRLRAQFPGLIPRIQPLEAPVGRTPAKRHPGETLKVAMIGAIGVQKGFNVLLAAANDAAERDLPIEFVVIGYTKDDNAVRRTGKVFVTGEYEEFEVAELLARESPDVALFASVFPETWCYALTHAIKAGLSIAAFDFGAIAERLRNGAGSGILFPLSATPRELNDGLLKAFPVARKSAPALPVPRAAAPPPPATYPGRPAGSAAPPRASDGLNPVDVLSRRTSSFHAMVPDMNQLTATVEILTLVKGLYLFSVGATDSRRVGDDHELILPALQVGLGPGTPADHVEFMAGPRTEGAWLCEPRDHIVVKVKATSTILLLTSIRAAGMAALEIDVKRLDGPQASRPPATEQQRKPAEPPPPNPIPREAIALPAQRQPLANPAAGNAAPSLPLRVTVHVQRRGDMVFNEASWAGVTGQRLSVESFSILPLDEIQPAMIEYKAVTASGVETPWVTGGALCGTRGMGMPLVGFAVRMKPDDAARNYVCEYSAVMVSGTTLGPARDGAPCRSVDIADPIEAIWISIRKTDAAPALARPMPQGSEAALPRPAGSEQPRPQAEAQRPIAAAAAEPPKARAPIGPRFSVFRDPAE